MPPLQAAVKDLRSQVCREACLTVAYIAKQLGIKSEYFFEPLMSTLFNLLVANAKVVSITGSSTILLVYECVPTHRLITPLQTQMQSKAKDIRRHVCQVLKVILQNWPANIIQKNLGIVVEIMKKGISDADGEARTLTRGSFADFRDLFPQAANQVLDSLDPLQRRQVQQSLDKQQPSSQAGGGGGGVHKTNGTSGGAAKAGNTSSLTRQGSIKKPTGIISGIPMLASRASPAKTPGGGLVGVNSGRSTSAIDLQAANRARQHHFSTLK